MNKNKFYIIFTCSIVVVLIIFEIVMYCFVGVDALSKKGIMRIFWIIFPIVILGMSLLRDLIIKRKYGDNDKK